MIGISSSDLWKAAILDHNIEHNLSAGFTRNLNLFNVVVNMDGTIVIGEGEKDEARPII